jgi:outer membrane protein OmpA-like peptidoglycan-associated protein
MKFKVSRKFDIGLEGTFTFTNSDKLDAMNFQTSIDKYGTVVNSLSKINRDGYAYVNINLTYKFGRIKSQNEHVEWVNPFEMMMAYTDEQIAANKPKEPEFTDTDRDGVLDVLDLEANTPEGYAVDTKGVTLDSDKDGCPDATDPEPYSNPLLAIADCKNTEGIASASAVAAPTGLSKDTVAAMIKEYDGWQLTSVYYDLDKSNVNLKASKELQDLGFLMSKYPDMKVNVVGHTDTRASAQYNQLLSEKRIANAIDYLFKNFGIVKDRFIPVPKGATDNVVPNATKENEHQLNRRVDFFPVKTF